MFGAFGKKEILKTGVLEGMIDIHSHVLPCVDDGSQSLEHSMDIIGNYRKMGVSKVFCTPHIKDSMPNNTNKRLEDSFAKFAKEDLSVEVRLSAEYMLDEHFLEVMASDKMLSFDGEHVLIEINRRNTLDDIFHMLFEISLKGYIPILAHPERYLSINRSDMLAIKERGVLLQLNMPSLTNYYGKSIGKRARSLFDDGLYDFVATDFHNKEQLEYVSSLRLTNKDTKILASIISNNNSLWKL